MKKLTTVQSELLQEISQYMSQNCPIRYDILKGMSTCKSFENSFNALVFKGYVVAHKTNDFSNQFKLNN